MAQVLTRFRRHTKDCPHRHKGRDWEKCDCPVHCQGKVGDVVVRESLDTRDWSLARRLIMELEHAIATGRVLKRFDEAVAKFLGSISVADETEIKYTRWAGYLLAFAEEKEIIGCDQWTLELLDDYKATRKVSDLTWQKELQFLRQMFGWFVKRKYLTENVAKEMEMPRDPQPATDHEPYTADEMVAILKACDEFGRASYERTRAKALVLLGRNYGLRISDACLLSREKVRGGQIMLRARKNDVVIWAPIYPEVQAALDRLPHPRGASPDSPYYFWAGPESSKPESFVKTTERTMQAMFRKSRVANAHFHRFRHTLATELLIAGGTIEDVANILGDDPETIRKHYAKWSPAYQERTTALLNRVRGGVHQRYAPESDLASPLFSIDSVVAKVGVDLPKKTRKQ
jgi:integrase